MPKLAGVVMRFPQVSDTGGCPHPVLVLRDGDCGAIQCEECGKRWQGVSKAEQTAAIRARDCNPPWFRALKLADPDRNAVGVAVAEALRDFDGGQHNSTDLVTAITDKVMEEWPRKRLLEIP